MSPSLPDADDWFAWPDLLVQIDTVTRVSGRLHLRFRGVLAGSERRDFGECEISDPAMRLNRLSETLDDWASGQTDERKSIETHLAGIGIGLYEELIPPALGEYYWSSLHAGPGSTVLLLVEDEAANLPWELVKPVLGDTVAPFWCEQLSISRWIGSRPMTIELPGQRAACVLASAELYDVSDPARSRLGVPESDVVTGWDGVERLLADTGLGLFHWTGHGQLNPDHPSLSELPIGDETFRPVDILVPTTRGFLRSGPWVFLHACSTNRSTVGSVGLAGWPKDLIERGAGAMLGAAWDVRTSTASLFVDSLYERLLKGVPAAQAVREARNAAKFPGDPSWLAYQLYAHPTARVLRDRTHGRFTSVSLRTLLERAFMAPGDTTLDWRRPYLEGLAADPLQLQMDLVPLGGSFYQIQDLEYSTIYVEPVVPESVVVREVRDIAEAASEHDGVVLLGESGAGKTISLHRIAKELAARALRGDPDVPTPVLISLYEYGTDDDPLKYIVDRCHDDALSHRLTEELGKGRICLLLDGLNEMTRHEYLRKVRAWREFMARWKGNRFVFACRSSAYRGELRLPEIEIAPLDDERILRTIFLTLGESADEFWEAILQCGLLNVARMPLFLEWLIMSFRRSGSRLPANRTKLLEGIVSSLVRREEDAGSIESLEFRCVMAALGELAHAILQDSANGAVPREQAWSVFESCHPGRERSVIEEGWRFAFGAGFLSEQQEEIRFREVRFRDYFAAFALHRRQTDGVEMRRYFEPSAADRDAVVREHVGPPAESAWAEPVILASGMAASADRLLTEVAAVNPRLAGDCLTRNSPKVTPGTVEEIGGALLRCACDPHVVVGERVAAGLTLGRLGDPRLRRAPAGFVLPKLCSIPAGSVWLGSGPDDEQAFRDERPQHLVGVDAFRIGRYQVTNAEYQAFVEAGGYDEVRYWTVRGWAWRRARDTGESSVSRQLRNLAYFRGHPHDMETWFADAGLDADERHLWRDLVEMTDDAARSRLRMLGRERVRSKDAPAFVRYPALTGANQPVVGVSWYEAVAYCGWLSEVSGTRFALPTEAQWERAAKGDGKRIYPWGNDWAADRCNALSENLSRTAPVGVFPEGRSFFGCEDMAGNVAEWTSSRYLSYPGSDEEGQRDAEADEVRVTRGGGWDSTPRVVRCALRGDMSEARTDGAGLGFRIVTGPEMERPRPETGT